jgi:hexosaminidase
LSVRLFYYSLYGARTEKLDCGLKVEHENGALYYFTPSNRTFMGINPGNTIVCNYLNTHWMVSRTDNMPNWYVTSLGMQPKTIQHTQGESLDYVGKFNTPEKWKREKTDQYDPFTPAVQYDMYKTSLDTVRQPYKIVPTPSNMKLDDSASFMFTSNDWVVLSSSEFGFEANYLAGLYLSTCIKDRPSILICCIGPLPN